MEKKKQKRVYWCLIIDENNYPLDAIGTMPTLKKALQWFTKDEHQKYLDDDPVARSVIAVPVEGRLNKLEIIIPL